MVADKLRAVHDQVVRAAVAANRYPAEVTMVSLSKGQPVEEILEAYSTGNRHFGENRAAELSAKATLLPSDIEWHFIVSLQTRQAQIARPHTSLLHSLDRSRLVNAWSAAEPMVPALLQVNVAAEPQKHGAEPAAVGDLLRHATDRGIPCVGLMTMAPLGEDPEDSRRWFAALRQLRDEIRHDYPQLNELSMGMTDDFAVAIEEGATIIRVGRAIFGPPGVPARSN